MHSRRRTSLRPRRIGRALYFCLLASVLCLGHLQIRFLTADLRRQNRVLQSSQQELVSELGGLERQTAQLSGLRNLEYYARLKVGMVDSLPDTSSVAVLPRALVMKYSTGLPHGEEADARDAYGPVASLEPSPVRDMLITLLDFNRAFAAVTLGKDPEDAGEKAAERVPNP